MHPPPPPTCTLLFLSEQVRKSATNIASVNIQTVTSDSLIFNSSGSIQSAYLFNIEGIYLLAPGIAPRYSHDYVTTCFTSYI